VDAVPPNVIPRNVNKSCRKQWEPKLQSRLDALAAKLDALYADVVGDGTVQRPGHLADDGARVMAIGYPRPFPDDPPDSCSLGNGSPIGINRVTMLWLNSVADRIDSVVRDAAARNPRVDYVDVSDVLSTPIDGVRHDLCIDGSQRWINRLIPSDEKRSMHPTFGYHEQVAARVLACWRDRQDCAV
jgi:hypothetical protein